MGVFKKMFETYLEIQKDKLDTEKLNLDGTHSLVKNRHRALLINIEKEAEHLIF